jgi:hypothetical protein
LEAEIVPFVEGDILAVETWLERMNDNGTPAGIVDPACLLLAQ